MTNMNYVDHLDLFGVTAKEIPCIKLEGAPTDSTVGAVGLFAMDTLTGDVWKCVSVADGKYGWERFGEGSPEAVKYTAQNLTEEYKTQARTNIGAAVETNKFYTNLSLAITDINNGNWNNAITDISAAKVKVFTAHNGKLTVMLLDDVTESVQIDINKDIELVLNGKTLNFNAVGAYLNFTSGTNCAINGVANGSKIVKNVSNASASQYAVNTESKLYIKGGTYEITGSGTKNIIAIRMASAGELLEIVDATVVSEASGNATGLCIQSQGKTLNVKSCTLTASSEIASSSIMAMSDITIEYSNISSSSGNGIGKALDLSYCDGKEIFVKNSHISATSQNKSAIGIDCDSGTPITPVVTVKDSVIIADAYDCHASTVTAIGISAMGTLICEDCDVRGTHSGIQTSEGCKLYINGGSYNGFCHGGIYFTQGSDGVAYVNDATLTCGDYQGIFDYSGKTAEIYGCAYIGGGSEARSNNMTIYMDGCTLGTAEGGNALVLRGSSGETNNTVNISNSNIVAGGGIRVDNDTHTLNIGIGCNITAANVSAAYPPVMTGKLYRRNYEDKVLDGRDYDALNACVQESVKYTAQTLTEEQKAQTRENIGVELEAIKSYYSERMSLQRDAIISMMLSFHEVSYYSTLTVAVTDANSGTIGTNADADANSAVACAYSNNGYPYVVLLKDTVESTSIQPTVDMTINLGGHKLSSEKNICIIVATVNVIIDGRIDGSTIELNIAKAKPVQVRSGSLVVHGGTYIADSTSGEAATFMSAGKLDMHNATIVAKSPDNYAYGVYVQSGQTTVSDCNISTSSTTLSRCINNLGGTVTISGCDIKAYSEYRPNGDGYVLEVDGVYNKSVATISNCDIRAYSDYFADGDTYTASSQGVYNTSTATLEINNCYVLGTLVGLQNNGTLYVDGGTFESYGHGGIYFTGTGTTAYVRNATLNDVLTMPDGYTGTSQHNGGGFYIGGAEGADNISVYMDNCDIYGSNYPIVLRGSTGEQNNTLYISNSRINLDYSTTGARIDNDTHKLYLGVGNNFTAENTDRPSAVIVTDEVYVQEAA